VGSGVWGMPLLCALSPDLDCVSSPAQSVLVRFDRPFLFLRHDKTSTLWACTYIGNHKSRLLPHPTSWTRSPSHAPVLRYPQLEHHLSRAHLNSTTPTIIQPTLTTEWNNHLATNTYRHHARNSTYEGDQGWVKCPISHCTSLRQVRLATSLCTRVLMHLVDVEARRSDVMESDQVVRNAPASDSNARPATS
jgi:hypothetical protein